MASLQAETQKMSMNQSEIINMKEKSPTFIKKTMASGRVAWSTNHVHRITISSTGLELELAAASTTACSIVRVPKYY